MNKQIPAVSKIIEFQNFKRSVQLHENKIRNAKPTLTTRIQMKESQSSINLNKTAKQPHGNSFSRMIDIQLQNRALLRKLIQKSQPKIHHPANYNNPPQPWQQPEIAKLPPNNRRKYYQQHQRRLQNEGLLRRIKQSKPMYQMRKFVSQRKATQKIINTISKFNYKDYKPNKTLIKFDASRIGDGQMEKLNLSRKKRNWLERMGSEEDEKENKGGGRQLGEKCGQYKKKHEQPQQKPPQPATAAAITTQRSLKRNQKAKTQKRQPPQQLLQHNHQQQFSPICQMRSSHISSSNLSLSQSFYHYLPQQQIRLNGKTFLLKGRQSMTKLKLELLQVGKNKAIGNEFIHEVQIPTHVYNKKFDGRIDVLIQKLRFDSKAQGFYLL